MGALQTWVINLDRAPDRLARVRQQLERLQLPWQRLPAVDARALTPAQRALLDEPAFHRRHGMTPLPGELGCYLSHVEVMRRFLAGDAEAALVLEDDVRLQDTLPAVLAALMRCPGRWDVVKLSAVHSGTPVPVADLGGGHALAVMLSKCTGSSAYLMNRRAAAAWLRDRGGLLPMRLPYDHAFDRAWLFGLKQRLVVPTPCSHDDQVASTIGAPATMPSRKFRGLRRWPTHLWRLGNELRRVAYGLGQLAREKLS
ncbi:MAG: glycosyltransferase family 25 protein [Betaproteobacteria bacterium]